MYLVSGGFATVNPDSTMAISAMETVPVEQLDPKMVTDGLAETSKRVAKDDAEKAEIQIHQEIYQAMNNAINKLSTIAAK